MSTTIEELNEVVKKIGGVLDNKEYSETDVLEFILSLASILRDMTKWYIKENSLKGESIEVMDFFIDFNDDEDKLKH